jgi:putative RNA 2'-phosphotransferase
VHLTANKETAKTVGGRHGKPVVLIINALAMHHHQHLFYLSDNGVWLTHHVPINFISW